MRERRGGADATRRHWNDIVDIDSKLMFLPPQLRFFLSKPVGGGGNEDSRIDTSGIETPTPYSISTISSM